MKYVTAVLMVLVVAAGGNTVASRSQDLLPELLEKSAKWEDLGIAADVNDYVDNVVHMIVPFIQVYGLDPMSLPDIEEGFEVRPVLITYSAWLRIHSGYMTGLSKVSRSGDQLVNYFAKMLRIRLKLQFTDLEIVYKYLLQVMNIGPTGGIIGTLDRFVVNVDLLIDFNNDEVHLQDFSLTDIGRIRARLTGNILLDWLINPVVNVFIRLFDTIIIRVIESNILATAQSAVALINSNIKDILAAIEAINP